MTGQRWQIAFARASLLDREALRSGSPAKNSAPSPPLQAASSCQGRRYSVRAASVSKSLVLMMVAPLFVAFVRALRV